VRRSSDLKCAASWNGEAVRGEAGFLQPIGEAGIADRLDAAIGKNNISPDAGDFLNTHACVSTETWRLVLQAIEVLAVISTSPGSRRVVDEKMVIARHQ